MYDPTRLKYPLKRVGKRGEGKWKRVSWDEALDEIADRMVDIISQDGPDTILWDVGTNFSIGSQSVGLTRLAVSLGTPLLDMNPEIGDGHYGVAITLGKIINEGSGDNWFYTDLFLIWGGNPTYTHIPNSHYYIEGRYNGAKIVTISPDYSPSAIHADLWIPINVGTDAAFALSLAHIIVKEKLYKASFLKEQTDMPLLVRDDNRLFLREKDLKEGGQEDVFYFFDLTSKSIKEAPKVSLGLNGLDPALEGEYEVETLQGKVKVRPVFELLKKRLEEYSPDKASKITGINPKVINDLAHEIAKAKAVCNITQSNFSKFYHVALLERAELLVAALCGHFGKQGSGFRGFPFLMPDAFETFPFLKKPGVEGVKEFEAWFDQQFKPLKDAGYTEEMLIYEFIRQAYIEGFWTSNTLFWYIHGGLKELSGRSKEWDRYLKREVDDYLKESFEKGWQMVVPTPEKEPRGLFEYGGNILRRVRGYTKLIDTLYPKLKLAVTIDWRMSSTGLHSDFVLPLAGWYEKEDIKWVTPINPFVHITNRAVQPLYESKTDWEIFCLLAKKIEEKAKQKGIETYKVRGEERRFDSIYSALTFGGYYKDNDDIKLADDYVKISSNTKGVTWDKLTKKGFAHFSGVGRSPGTIGNATDIKPNETIVPLTWHTDKKIPYPTLTRRMQFYIDHELFFDLGEELPVYKEPPKSGGNYPLVVTGGHTRWSIHSSWRDSKHMLRLQRGVPIMYMSTLDAQKRGIKDGEEVEVKNDLNSFRIHVKVSPSVKPGQVMIYHAWENYQFKDGKLFQNLMPTPLNPISLAGGYYHLRPMFLCLHPPQNDRDTRVEVVKIT
jgi:DMSO reductase family type II enzyme molybdopterin subunit